MLRTAMRRRIRTRTQTTRPANAPATTRSTTISTRTAGAAASASAALIAIAACAATAFAQNDETINTLTPAEKAAGWTLLFDGESTEHWRGYNRESFPSTGWVVEDDGTLHVKGGEGGGDLMTRRQYADFELSLEFRTAEGANSGIMYRVTEKHPAPWMTGPEYQILDDAAHQIDPDHLHAAGACYALYKPSKEKILKPAGEFNRARIRVKNNRVSHFLNGVKLLEFDLTSNDYAERVAASKFAAYDGFGVRPKGHLALQDHGDDVWFRNIKARDLTAPMPEETALFNGRNLDGWTWYSPARIAAEGVWSVGAGEVLRCEGTPPGYLRTEEVYDHFVLKLEWRWDPDAGPQRRNSGVLVRRIGEDRVWPKSVEAQLMHGSAGDFWKIGEYPMTTDPDRTNGRNTKKLTDAERPIGEWNQYEIIVDDETVTLYVNGQLVNRAWDVEVNEGHICLQSEGAPIEFRNIRLAPIR